MKLFLLFVAPVLTAVQRSNGVPPQTLDMMSMKLIKIMMMIIMMVVT